jgi:large conductance mechanosensitive channel
MGFLKEFKEFAVKGNIIDLAVAVVIGAAFSAIVSSLVDDVITPLILTPALNAAHAADLHELAWGPVKYGLFLAAVIKFVLVALVLFFVIKGINVLMKKNAEAPPEPAAPSSTDQLLIEIRDLLKK